MKLRAAVAEASSGDHYDTLAAAPRVKQMLVLMRAQLRALDQQAAEADGAEGCVAALRLQDGANAELLQNLAQASAIDQWRTDIRFQSRILQPAHHDDLQRFFGDIPVSR